MVYVPPPPLLVVRSARSERGAGGAAALTRACLARRRWRCAALRRCTCCCAISLGAGVRRAEVDGVAQGNLRVCSSASPCSSALSRWRAPPIRPAAGAARPPGADLGAARGPGFLQPPDRQQRAPRGPRPCRPCTWPRQAKPEYTILQLPSRRTLKAGQVASGRAARQRSRHTWSASWRR